jgi:hypothetical protein
VAFLVIDWSNYCGDGDTPVPERNSAPATNSEHLRETSESAWER